MSFKNFFSMYSRYYLMFPAALVTGLVLGLLLPAVIQTIIGPVASIITRVILYITIPYFFFSLFITTYELSAIRQWSTTLRVVFVSSLIGHAGIVFMSMIIFLFFPAQNLIPLTRNITPVATVSFDQIITTILPTQWMQVFSARALGPLLLLAILLGAAAQKIIPHNHSLLEVFSGVRSILMHILQITLPWFTIAVVILIVQRVDITESVEFLSNFRSLIIMLTVITLTLLFVIFPLLLSALKIPMYFTSWLRKLIPATIVAFAGGSVVTAGGFLLHAEIPKNPRRKMIDTVVSLSFIVARIGVALIIALSYMLLYKAFNSGSMGIGGFLTVFVMSISLSFLSEVMPAAIIPAAIATLSHIEFISVQNLYLIIITLIPLLNGFAAAVDALCCGFLQLYIKHRIAEQHPAPFSLQQDDDSL